MSGKILQLNFTFNVSAGEYEQAVSPLAEKFAAVPGLRWKIWLMNEDKKEAGGIYFFDNASSLENFLSGELAATVSNHPALSDMSVKKFDIMEKITATTRGPV